MTRSCHCAPSHQCTPPHCSLAMALHTSSERPPRPTSLFLPSGDIVNWCQLIDAASSAAEQSASASATVQSTPAICAGTLQAVQPEHRSGEPLSDHSDVAVAEVLSDHSDVAVAEVLSDHSDVD